MILEIIAAHASWTNNRLSVAFDVVPETLSHLDLKTGEIFQDDATAKLRNQSEKAISAQLYVTWKDRNAAGNDMPSEMRYMSSRSSEPLISLVWRLPDDHLASLHSLIIGGHVPRRAVISFPHDKLGFTWEPDGRGQTWDNEQERAVPIEDVRFDLAIPSPTPADATSWVVSVPTEPDPAFYSDQGKVNFTLLQRVSSIETTLSRVSAAVGGVALLMLLLVISHFWH